MPGCSSRPVISASSRKRARLSGSSACSGWISFRATSRCSSASRATETTPEPALARGAGGCGTRPPEAVGADAPGERASVGVGAPSRSPGAAERSRAERGLDVGVPDPAQVLARPCRARRRRPGSAPDHRRASRGGGATRPSSKAPGRPRSGPRGRRGPAASGRDLILRPGLEGGDEVGLVDQAVLQARMPKSRFWFGGSSFVMARSPRRRSDPSSCRPRSSA